MTEKGTPRLARAHDAIDDELLKEELQRRLDKARESISQTVTEIKDTVVHRYESVKDRVSETLEETLDWREQFRQRPVTWSLGAIGVGFITGYWIAASDDSDHDDEPHDYAPETPHAYAAKPILGATAASSPGRRIEEREEESHRGLLERFQETQAYHHLEAEASALANRFVDEVSQTAKEVLLPAAVGVIRGWLVQMIPPPSAPTNK